MKTLVAVLSCWPHRKFHDQIVDTWASPSATPAELSVKFFLGAGENAFLASDEVALPVGDGWDSLPSKLMAACQFALADGYEWMFKCDTDTYVHLPRLAAAPRGSGMTGWRGPFGSAPPYGGTGYWLSAEAMRAVVDGGPRKPGEPVEEDFFAAGRVEAAGLPLSNDYRYQVFTPPLPSNQVCTYHPQDKSMLDPAKLRAVHLAASQIVVDGA